MKRRIGGEIVRWNATRFGTVFMFLQSLWERKDKFRQWMVSDEWRNNSWNNEAAFKYVDGCMTSSQWWDDVKVVLDTIGPLFLVLRYVDGDEGTVAGLMPRLLNAIKEMEIYLGEGTQRCNRYMKVIKDRVQYLYSDTFIVAAAVLDPVGHYGLRLHENNRYLRALEEAIERLAVSIDSGIDAIRQIRAFICYEGKFDGKLARGAVGKMAADWWVLFGGDTPELQKYAIRIVSQCVSSSGCERNWSTFALVHTKVRNCLGYEKLRKLVYVRHNLKQRLKHAGVGKNQTKEKEADPCAMLIDCTLFDESNPIMDWLNEPRFEDDLSLEEMLGQSKKRRILALQRASRRKGKRAVEHEEDIVESENDTDEDSPHGSPIYAESGDSSSSKDTDNELEPGDGDTLATQQQFEEQADNNNGRAKRPRKKRVSDFLYS